MSTETPPDGVTAPDYVPCLIIGGVADGIVIPQMRSDADVILLQRPSHIKPLASSDQAQPEVAKEADRYRVHTMYVEDDLHPGDLFWFAVATLLDVPLPRALGELFIAYTRHVTNRLIAEGRVDESVITPTTH